MTAPRYDVVVPTVGRPSLATLLRALAAGGEPRPERVVVVDDRRERTPPLLDDVPTALEGLVRVLPGPAAGPAAARNLGWRAGTSPWVVFLDDDVEPGPGWPAALAADLGAAGAGTAGVQARIDVPLPHDRPPTDWERNVAGLERARWVTADLAYRRSVLEEVGGFDERFPRAYREDADLGLRVTQAGYTIVRGQRRTAHPVRPADPWVSVRLQAGNADDAVMAALHGRGWERRAGVPRGRRRVHLAVTTSALAAAAAGVAGRRDVAAVAGLGWLVGTAEFAWRRIRPGPRDPAEAATMLATSAVIPLAASYHWVKGLFRAARVARDPLRVRPAPSVPRPEAVLVDRDGTLVADVPYNGDPDRVRPLPGVAAALDRFRAAGLKVGVVTNQSGVARGLISRADVAAVNDRVEQLLGPFDGWFVCPHGPGDGCECRKPAPGLVLKAAADLGVAPRRCVVVGDIGADVAAAASAGARGVLVPTPRTRREEVLAAAEVAADFAAAAERVVGPR